MRIYKLLYDGQTYYIGIDAPYGNNDMYVVRWPDGRSCSA